MSHTRGLEMAELPWVQKWIDGLWSTTLVRRWTCGLALWLGVWMWVAILVAAERSAAVEPAVLKLSLGWLPCAIASVLTSLYLQAGGNYVGIHRKGMLLGIVAGIAFVWTFLQGYLGGVGNATLAAVILVAGELQSWLGRVPETERAALSRGEEPSPALERDGRDEPSQAESRTNAVGMEAAAVGALAAGSAVGPDEVSGPGALIAAEREANNDARCAASSESCAEVDEEDEQADGECAGDEELEEAAEDNGAAERRGDWLQQMTRSRHESIEAGVAEAESDSQVERLEWFGRQLWRATETQVNLHVLFQPAFGERPRVTVEVVEGAGQVSVAELQPHGARLLLKRPADTANRTDATVVWLEAIGPVNRED